MIDTELKQHVQSALDWEPSLDASDIGVSVDQGVVTLRGVSVTVTNGWIALSGTLDWQYQKDAVARAVRDLTAVKGVTNNITVQSHVKTMDVRSKIEAAFKRSAEIDARRVNVTAQNGKVILSGNVHSWAERQEAERAAWAAPGVTQVEDRIAIVP